MGREPVCRFGEQGLVLLEYHGDYHIWLRSGVNPEPYELRPGQAYYLDARDWARLSPEWQTQFVAVED